MQATIRTVRRGSGGSLWCRLIDSVLLRGRTSTPSPGPRYSSNSGLYGNNLNFIQSQPNSPRAASRSPARPAPPPKPKPKPKPKVQSRVNNGKKAGRTQSQESRARSFNQRGKARLDAQYKDAGDSEEEDRVATPPGQRRVAFRGQGCTIISMLNNIASLMSDGTLTEADRQHSTAQSTSGQHEADHKGNKNGRMAISSNGFSHIIKIPVCRYFLTAPSMSSLTTTPLNLHPKRRKPRRGGTAG